MTVSKCTICRILKKKYKIRKNIRTCYLTNEQKDKRVQFCKKMLKSGIRGKQIFFTDETKISLGEYSGKMRISEETEKKNKKRRRKCNKFNIKAP